MISVFDRPSWRILVLDFDSECRHSLNMGPDQINLVWLLAVRKRPIADQMTFENRALA